MLQCLPPFFLLVTPRNGSLSNLISYFSTVQNRPKIVGFAFFATDLVCAEGLPGSTEVLGFCLRFNSAILRERLRSQAAPLKIDSRRLCQLVVSRSRFCALICVCGRCFVKRASPDAQISDRRIVKRDYRLGRGTHSLAIECKRGPCFLRTIGCFRLRLSKQFCIAIQKRLPCARSDFMGWSIKIGRFFD